MRECFQILDGDNDGRVTREDVVDMLTNLGIFFLCPLMSLGTSQAHQNPS